MLPAFSLQAIIIAHSCTLLLTYPVGGEGPIQSMISDSQVMQMRTETRKTSHK